MSTAVVVGSGPNGLTAAALLARAGVEVTVLEAADRIGGGATSYQALVPGLVHDHCSAVHPMAIGSPALAALGLADHGLSWRLPELDCVHPLPDGTAAVLHRSLARTVVGLGADGPRWRGLLGHAVRHHDALTEDILGPLLRPPRHPLLLARFGLPASLPAAAIGRLFGTPQARALWAGIAAHAYRPLHHPLSSAVGLGIAAAGHRHGWGVAQGGSQRIADALAASLRAAGGRIETGMEVRSAAELPRADAVVWDVAPGALPALLGDAMSAPLARVYRRFRRGPGAAKVDFAVRGGVPWTAEAARRAGTVHVGGAADEVGAALRAVHRDRLPERPFVLVGQQYLADPGRSVGDVHPVWAYAHVPNGWDGDPIELVTARIEQYAPGFRDCVVGAAATRPADFAAANPNFAGGDILTGAKDVRQLVLGPRTSLQPYDVGVPGHYLCSAATPPGPGAHGMCGAGAAARVLRQLSGRSEA